MATAGRAIEDFVRGRTREDYQAELMLRSAVERQFEILGEALRRLTVLDPTITTEISEHGRIIAFRNIIAHGYDTLDGDIVWQAVTEKLPVPLREIDTMLAGTRGG